MWPGQNVPWKSDQFFSRDLNQIVENGLSCSVEESFGNIYSPIQKRMTSKM